MALTHGLEENRNIIYYNKIICRLEFFQFRPRRVL